jgi:hypothetical protein
MVNFEIVHQACWPTLSRHARLSAACLVEATSDNDLNDDSNSMSIKTEIMSLRLDVNVIFNLQVRIMCLAKDSTRSRCQR